MWLGAKSYANNTWSFFQHCRNTDMGSCLAVLSFKFVCIMNESLVLFVCMRVCVCLCACMSHNPAQRRCREITVVLVTRVTLGDFGSVEKNNGNSKPQVCVCVCVHPV